MSDVMLTSSQLALRDKARKFAREEVRHQLLLDMDAEKVYYRAKRETGAHDHRSGG